MESIERKTENYAIVFNVNLIRATLNEAVEFKDYLAEAIKGTDKDIIVNLSACEHLDSTFLGVLVSSYKRLKTQNRTLVIIEPIDQSSIFLTLNSIGKIFPLYTSVKAALEDIENKKLLEKEINELSTEQILITEKLSNASSNFISPIDNDKIMQAKVEEIQEDKFQIEPLQVNETQKISETAYEKQNDSKGKSWNLIEYNDYQTADLNIVDNNLDEQISDFESERVEEQQVIITHPRTSEERHFGSESIKWEFGFSS